MLAAFFLKGIVVGIIIAVPVGPVGVLCVRRTIIDGRLAGLLSGLGAATADMIFGIIAGFGLTFISDWLLGYKDWLRIGGAIFLLYVGVSAFRSKPKTDKNSHPSAESLLAAYASTFALTITNPVTILAFLAIFTSIGFSGSQATFGRAGILVLGVVVGSLLWWLGLSFGAGFFRKSLHERQLIWMNRGSGGLLILSGLALFGTWIAERLG